MMYLFLFGVGITGLLFAGCFQGKNPDLKMKGDRFVPLTYEELSPEQKTMADNILSGERGTMDGPYNVLLRSAIVGDLAQKYGASIRFHSSIPKKLNELAILLTARYWNSEFEWYVHRKFAIQAGLSIEMIDAIREKRVPAGMSADEQATYEFCQELLVTKKVSDSTFANAKTRFGERGVVDLISVLGYYHLVSMVLNVDRYPLPPNTKSELEDTDKMKP